MTGTTSTSTPAGTIVPVLRRSMAIEMAEALRTFEGADALPRYRAEHGGWHVFIRTPAGTVA